jgi:hypothetical protein
MALSTVQHRVVVPLPPLTLVKYSIYLDSDYTHTAHRNLYSSLTATTVADATTMGLICAGATVPDDKPNPSNPFWSRRRIKSDVDPIHRPQT